MLVRGKKVFVEILGLGDRAPSIFLHSSGTPSSYPDPNSMGGVPLWGHGGGVALSSAGARSYEGFGLMMYSSIRALEML